MCVSDLKLAILTIFEPLHGLVKCSTSHTTITTLFSGPPSSPGRSSGGTTQPVPALAPGASSLNLPGQLPLGGGVTHYSSCIRLLREVGSHGTHPLAPASFSQCRFLLSVPLPSLSVASFSQCRALKFTCVAACVGLSFPFEDGTTLCLGVDHARLTHHATTGPGLLPPSGSCKLTHVQHGAAGVCTPVCASLPVSLDTHPGLGSLPHTVKTKYLIFLRNHQTVFHQQCMRIPTCPHVCWHLFSDI